MKYNQLEKHTAKPVTKIITYQNKKLAKLINSTDNFYQGHFENMPKGKIFVQFKGHIPIYIKGEYYLFQRLQIQQWERLDLPDAEKITKSSKELLKELLKAIEINRVHDEDGQNGFFSKDNSEGTLKGDVAYCYVNPNIPDGYWENHLLETKFIE